MTSSIELTKLFSLIFSLISASGLASGVLLIQPLALANRTANKDDIVAVAGALSVLPDGAYQFCTEPALKNDWKDGAGACLTLVKQGTTGSGYYGYPHSESFICLEGQVSETGLSGSGTAFSWPGHPWSNIPETSFYWDDESRLSLAEGDWVRQEGEISWIIFQQAVLNTEGMYQYATPQMTPPEQLCDWKPKTAIT